MTKLNKAVIVVSALLLAWLFASFVDTNAHNMSDLEYAKWNLFDIAFGNEEPVKAESVVAECKVETEPIATVKPTAIPTEKPKTTKKAKEKKVRTRNKSNQRDVLNLARIIQAENGGHKDDEALLLTGVVVMKRVKSDEYPDTILGVVSQKGQYSTYADGKFWNNPTKRCRKIAKKILETDIVDEYPDNLVFQAEFKQGKAVYKKLGYEYFCLA